MSKKDKKRSAQIDFDIGIGEIIPATQEAFSANGFSEPVRKEEKASTMRFKSVFLEKIELALKETEQFPSVQEIFVFIVQYFESEKEYNRRDVDNMAKTILDVLCERFYHDDSQVKTLLVGKKMVDTRVSQNFAYVAIKELKSAGDVDALKISGLERSVTMFQELKSRGVL